MNGEPNSRGRKTIFGRETAIQTREDAIVENTVGTRRGFATRRPTPERPGGCPEAGLEPVRPTPCGLPTRGPARARPRRRPPHDLPPGSRKLRFRDGDRRACQRPTTALALPAAPRVAPRPARGIEARHA